MALLLTVLAIILVGFGVLKLLAGAVLFGLILIIVGVVLGGYRYSGV